MTKTDLPACEIAPFQAFIAMHPANRVAAGGPDGSAPRGGSLRQVAMRERAIRADGLELATQSFGDPAHPATLLIMGGMASMLWWPQEFCERLASQWPPRHPL